MYQARDADHRVPQDILQPAESTLPHKSFSGLERRVVDALLAALQSLDTCAHDGHSLMVEVDGPSHYRKDGSLMRKYQFKEALYKQVLPDMIFHRVHYKEEEASNADAAVSDFIQALSAARSGPAWLRIWKGFVRRMRAF